MELVKFNDGKYGIRRWRFSWVYYRFTYSMYVHQWIRITNPSFSLCRVSREEAELRMDAGTPTQRVIEPRAFGDVSVYFAGVVFGLAIVGVVDLIVFIVRTVTHA